mmetsp:Transcript_42369/g.76042  ORF Transcript_42369/g.76042 Transcript_42369/m.76042 type:complete len:320 (-) Transcript_42369:396-1355(-)
MARSSLTSCLCGITDVMDTMAWSKHCSQPKPTSKPIDLMICSMAASALASVQSASLILSSARIETRATKVVTIVKITAASIGSSSTDQAVSQILVLKKTHHAKLMLHVRMAASMTRSSVVSSSSDPSSSDFSDSSFSPSLMSCSSVSSDFSGIRRNSSIIATTQDKPTPYSQNCCPARRCSCMSCHSTSPSAFGKSCVMAKRVACMKLKDNVRAMMSFSDSSVSSSQAVSNSSTSPSSESATTLRIPSVTLCSVNWPAKEIGNTAKDIAGVLKYSNCCSEPHALIDAKPAVCDKRTATLFMLSSMDSMLVGGSPIAPEM